MSDIIRRMNLSDLRVWIFNSVSVFVRPAAVFGSGLHGSFLMRLRFLDRLFFHFPFLALLYFLLLTGSCGLFSSCVNDPDRNKL